jgi:hypothetical protein
LHRVSLKRENTKSPRKTIKKTSKEKYRKNKARKENPTEKSKLRNTPDGSYQLTEQ